MKLYGSTTSPFVRRIRMLLANIEHEFINMQIFAGADRETLASKNPTLKIPMLEVDDQVIFDSRVIFQFLSEKFAMTPLTWDEENQLTLIDAANDTFVQLLLLQRSGFDTEDDKLYFKLQRERVNETLKALDEMVSTGLFAHWAYPEMCLFSLVDWIEFRELHNLVGLDNLKAFRQKHAERIEVTATDPRVEP